MDYSYGYCGMPCALCSRYRTDGKSKCLGCSKGGYYTDTCKVFSCVRGKGIDHCGKCAVFPCVRVSKMGEFSDLRTDNAKQKTCALVASNGFESWYKEYSRRADLLTVALGKYNDGRMKRYLCELFITQSIDNIELIMKRAESLNGTQKENGKRFKEIVEEITSNI